MPPSLSAAAAAATAAEAQVDLGIKIDSAATHEEALGGEGETTSWKTNMHNRKNCLSKHPLARFVGDLLCRCGHIFGEKHLEVLS